MCTLSQTTQDQIKKTIDTFLKEGRLFTAYDITVETRKREKIRLVHREVCNDVHALIRATPDPDSGSALKERTVTLGYNTTAIVYSGMLAVGDYSNQPIAVPTDARTTDSRGRLFISREALKGLGLAKHDPVAVKVDSAKACVTLVPTALADPTDKVLKLSRDGDVTLSRKVYKSAGMDMGTFNVVNTPTGVVVSQ